MNISGWAGRVSCAPPLAAEDTRPPSVDTVEFCVADLTGKELGAVVVLLLVSLAAVSESLLLLEKAAVGGSVGVVVMLALAGFPLCDLLLLPAGLGVLEERKYAVVWDTDPKPDRPLFADFAEDDCLPILGLRSGSRTVLSLGGSGVWPNLSLTFKRRVQTEICNHIRNVLISLHALISKVH